MRATTARGAPYCNRYAFAFRFTDGQIREAYELLDSLSFQRQQAQER
jgi:ketosteroid isomerase-like protein